MTEKEIRVSELRAALERDITLEDDIYSSIQEKSSKEDYCEDYLISNNGQVINLDGTKCFVDDDGNFFTTNDLKDIKVNKYVIAKNECFKKNLSFQFYKYNPFDFNTIPRDGNGCLVDINQRALFNLQIPDFKTLNQAMLNFRDAQIITGQLIDENDDEGYGAWLVASDVKTLVTRNINSHIFPFEVIFNEELTLLQARPKIYCLLALYLIGSIKNKDIDINKHDSDMKLAVDAMELICDAERMLNSFEKKISIAEQKDAQRSEFRREQASAAGKAKRSPYEVSGTKLDVKKRWVDSQLKGIHKTKAEFKRDILEKVQIGVIPMPSGKSAHKYPLTDRTLDNWIKEFELESKQHI